MKIDPAPLAKFRNFRFMMRFDKQRIVAVSHEEQLQRSLEFMERLGTIHPLMRKWFRQGNSLKSALKYSVIGNPEFLAKEIRNNADKNDPTCLSYTLWNGEPDIFKGGLSLHYSAHNGNSLSYIIFNNFGSLVFAAPKEARSVTADLMGAAVEIWPEIDWASAAPSDYFLYDKTFKDRQTIGWIGFCPHTLKSEDFPEAYEVRPVSKRGTIIVNEEDIMDDKNLKHVAAVDKADTTLMHMGLLPLYNN